MGSIESLFICHLFEQLKKLGNCIFLQRMTLRLPFPPHPQGTQFEVFLKKEIKQESWTHDVPVRGTNLSSVHSAFCFLKLVWSVEAFGQAIKIIGLYFPPYFWFVLQQSGSNLYCTQHVLPMALCVQTRRHRQSTILMSWLGHTAINVPHEPRLELAEVKECFFHSFHLILTIMPRWEVTAPGDETYKCAQQSSPHPPAQLLSVISL